MLGLGGISLNGAGDMGMPGPLPSHIPSQDMLVVRLGTLPIPHAGVIQCLVY